MGKTNDIVVVSGSESATIYIVLHIRVFYWHRNCLITVRNNNLVLKGVAGASESIKNYPRRKCCHRSCIACVRYAIIFSKYTSSLKALLQVRSLHFKLIGQFRHN